MAKKEIPLGFPLWKWLLFPTNWIIKQKNKEISCKKFSKTNLDGFLKLLVKIPKIEIIHLFIDV
jgi:hypothetical protein